MFQSIPLPNPLARQAYADIFTQMAMLPRSLQKQDLENQAAQMKNQYYPQITQEQLRGLELGNENQQTVNQYQPRVIESGLGLQRAQTQNTLGEASSWKFRNALTQAQANDVPSQTAYRNAQIQGMPLNNLIEAQNALNSSSRFNSSYKMLQFLNTQAPADRYKWIAEHRDEYDRAMADAANPAMQTPQVLTQEAIASIYPQLAAQMQAPQQQQAPQQPQNPLAAGPDESILPSYLQNPLASGAPDQAQGQQNALNAQQQSQGRPEYNFRSNPEQIDQLKKASLASANNSLVTTQTQQRAESARILDQWISDERPYIDKLKTNAATYAGAIGKGKAGIDSLANTNPEAYQDYLVWKNSFIPNAINQIKMMEGLGASDSQREELNGMLDAAQKEFGSNPQRAIAYVDNALKMMEQIGKAVNTQAQPLGKALTVQPPEGQSQGMEVQQEQAQTKPSSSGSSDMVTIRTKDGKVGQIPRSNLKTAIEKFGVVVEG